MVEAPRVHYRSCMPRRRIVTIILALALAACGHRVPSVSEREAALEARLLAPCCWVQTLDSHQSPRASELRAEIRQRLTRGEPADRIEADLVARYGERLRAVPAGLDVEAMGALMFAFAALASTAILIWRTRLVARRPAATGSTSGDEDAELAARLDDDLDALD